jgi:fatty acid CoA ligase FadD9
VAIHEFWRLKLETPFVVTGVATTHALVVPRNESEPLGLDKWHRRCTDSTVERQACRRWRREMSGDWHLQWRAASATEAIMPDQLVVPADDLASPDVDVDGPPDHRALLQAALERGRRLIERDPELQRHALVPELIERIQERRTSIECLETACRLYSDRPCLGHRVAGEARFRHVSYGEVWRRVAALASGLSHAGVAGAGSFVGLVGFGSPDWVIADLACLYLGAVSVPLPAAPAATQLELICEAEPRCIVASAEELGRLTYVLPRCPSISGLVVMDLDEKGSAAMLAFAEHRRALQRAFPVYTLGELEQLGRGRDGLGPLVPGPGHDGDELLRTIVYTSGTTGCPKGAMYPERLWRQSWRPRDLAPTAMVAVNYLPMSQLAARRCLPVVMLVGGVVSFVQKSDLSTLFEDIQAARPTALLLVPRVLEIIHERFRAAVLARSATVDLDDVATRRWIEDDVIAEMRRRFLGDRLLCAVAATAKVAPEILAFTQRCFQIPVFDAYAQTETGCVISFDGRINRRDVSAFKLVDAPELGYRTTDRPHPRGELHIKSDWTIQGYYKNPEATEALLDSRGWLPTGDIFEQRGRDQLIWVDRKKSIVRLAHGEIVSPRRLEALYAARSPFIRQIYIYANSRRAYLLAVVVPRLEAAHAHLRQHGIAPDDAALEQLLLAEIRRIAAEARTDSWEIPEAIHLERTPFTRGNGLLTDGNQPSWAGLEARYGKRLERRHAELEANRLRALRALGRSGGQPAATLVARAVAVTLGLRDLDAAQMELSVARLGGDSIAVVSLATLLGEITGVDVQVGFLLDSTISVRAIAEHVEQRRAAGARAGGVTFASVHGTGATVARAADLALERFLGRDELAAAATTPPPASAQVVLLTGANGFLGRFLALELLERAPPGGRVVCLVRAANDDGARARFAAAYGDGDPTLRERVDALSADGRLEVRAGDLTRPRLGLADQVHERLAREVDAIVHNGALANSAFSYAQLFEPNVLGTVEVLRFALARRKKAIGLVSSVGVGACAGGRTDPVGEDEDALSLAAEQPLAPAPGRGHAATKWAAELLLREAHERLGMPVDIFRCGTILPHSYYRGQINTGAPLTRLLHGIVHTGVAPRSFYADEPGARHFNGAPVDVMARSIACIAVDGRAPPRDGYAIYHVVNPVHPPVSLDSFVDWIVSAGFHIRRIDDHARWLELFSARLAALGSVEQRRSPLPILDRWQRPIRAAETPRFDSRRLRSRLRGLDGAPEIVSPNEEQLHKLLRDMVDLRLIAPARYTCPS